jgi:hypothetical protein
MVVAVAGLPIILVVGIVFAIVVYVKTKSIKKVGFALEILLALAVMIVAAQLGDSNLVALFEMLGAGLLINGLISLLK